MPLSLGTQFRSAFIRYVLVPGLFLTLGGFLVAAFLLAQWDSKSESKVVLGANSILEQSLISGDYIPVGLVLRGLGTALKWKEGAIATESGTVVASFPDPSKLHLNISSLTCDRLFQIRGEGGKQAGTLCWKPDVVHRLIPALSVGAFMFSIGGVLLLLSFLRAGSIFRGHAEELEALSDRLLNPNADFLAQTASSIEGQKLIQAIEQSAEIRSQLQKAEFDRARSETISQLASQVAHDIRSPLSTLAVVADLATNLPAEHRELMLAATHRIHSIADELLNQRRDHNLLDGHQSAAEEIEALAFSDLSIAEEIEALAFSDLSIVIREQIRAKRAEWASRKRFDLVLAGADDIGRVYVRLNHYRLERILSNVVNNSAEAVGDQGWIKIQFGHEENWAWISVEDDGAGVPETILPYLGDRGRTFGKSKGNGLGLSDAKETLEGWGGKLEIQSEEGQGTKVTLWMPIVPSTESSPKEHFNEV